MSSWRVERHYGFGAAQIPIRAEPHASAQFGFVEGAGYLAAELVAGGPLATMRRLVGQVPALLLGALIVLTFVITLARDRSDRSPVEIVLFESLDEAIVPVPEIIPVVEEPLPDRVEVAQPEPPKPKPIPVVPPAPPKRELAARPKPVPVRVPVKSKPRTRPKPMIPQIAKIEAPKRAPVERAKRRIRDRPEAAARPSVAIEVASHQRVPTRTAPKVERVARAASARPKPLPSAPRLTAPAAPAFVSPADAPARSSFRVANAKPAANAHARTVPGMAPAPQYTDPESSAPHRAARRQAAAKPSSTARARRPAPTLGRAPVLTASAPADPSRERSARPAPRPSSRRAPRPAAAMAAASAPSARGLTPAVVSRAGRAAPHSALPRGQRDDRPGLAGVPLGELAACLSDRDEDRLKQAVVAAVTTQEECVSRKGTYRFIETKNLNAFLMWIDRAPSRAVSDRCVELGYALECLKSASLRAAR